MCKSYFPAASEMLSSHSLYQLLSILSSLGLTSARCSHSAVAGDYYSQLWALWISSPLPSRLWKGTFLDLFSYTFRQLFRVFATHGHVHRGVFPKIHKSRLNKWREAWWPCTSRHRIASFFFFYHRLHHASQYFTSSVLTLPVVLSRHIATTVLSAREPSFP